MFHQIELKCDCCSKKLQFKPDQDKELEEYLNKYGWWVFRSLHCCSRNCLSIAKEAYNKKYRGGQDYVG